MCFENVAITYEQLSVLNEIHMIHMLYKKLNDTLFSTSKMRYAAASVVTDTHTHTHTHTHTLNDYCNPRACAKG